MLNGLINKYSCKYLMEMFFFVNENNLAFGENLKTNNLS